jgi:hypothetical protein
MENHALGSAKRRGNRPNRPTKFTPLTREQLDARTHAAKLWDQMEARITSEVGGDVTAVQQALITAFCSVAISLNDLTAKNLLGQPTNIADLSLAASTLTRLAQRIGVARKVKSAAPTLSDMLREDARA